MKPPPTDALGLLCTPERLAKYRERSGGLAVSWASPISVPAPEVCDRCHQLGPEYCTQRLVYARGEKWTLHGAEGVG